MRLNPEEVTGLVLSLLSDELRWDKWRGNENAVAGQCYTASEVCRALLGPAWEPYMVPHERSFHWFLRHRDTGEILDATVAQFQQLPSYEKARPACFGRRTSAASEVLLWRVLEGLGAASRQEGSVTARSARPGEEARGRERPMAGRRGAD